MPNVAHRWIWFMLLSVLLCTRSTLVMAMQFGGAYQTHDLATNSARDARSDATNISTMAAATTVNTLQATTLATGLATMPACHQWQMAAGTDTGPHTSHNAHNKALSNSDSNALAATAVDGAPDHHCCILFGALPSASWPSWSPAVMAAIAQRLPSMHGIHLHALLRPPILSFSI
jgi:hypothetical protein